MGAEILPWFTEAKTGRKVDQPELGKMLHLAKVAGATLVIAKPDRLSRHAVVLLALRDSWVQFLPVDMPKSNVLAVGIMVLSAQAEREAIFRTTKEALAFTKAHGVKLGNRNGAASLGQARKGGAALRAAGQAKRLAGMPETGSHW
ncbi:MAG: resolvase N-terminal [Rhodobacteraceae bacterium]|nr:MAG: resolvase N-terminal [Paracoccaceae bacterium]